MRFGVNVSPVHPAALCELGGAAERLGFESLWYGEHIAIPRDPVERYPYTPDGKPPFPARARWLEPFAALSALAASTSTVGLGTGIALLPARHPIHFARAATTVDVLSGGRLLLGLGTGWSRDEFTALGVSFDDRGQLMDEGLDALKSLWTDEWPEHHGPSFDFPAIGFEPKPARQPHPPLLIGGDSAPALRRTARVGDGWFGTSVSPQRAGEVISRLHALLRANGREDDIPGFDVTVMAPFGAGYDADRVAEYEAAGVTRIVVTPWERSSLAASGLQEFAAEAGLAGS